MEVLRVYFVLVLSALLAGCSSDDPIPGNSAPETVMLSAPANNTREVDPESVEFTWRQAIDPDGDMVSYDIFLDKENPPATIVVSGTTAGVYAPQAPLEFDTPYYWKVVARDNKGGNSESEVAVFTTREATLDDLIAGRWYMESIKEPGERKELSDCEKNSFIQFAVSGKFMTTDYYTSSGPDKECRGVIFNAEYERVSDTEIKVFIPGENFETSLIIISISDTRMECRYSTDEDRQYVMIRE